MRRMSTKPGAQDGAVPPEVAADSNSNVDASRAALPEQIHEQAMARLAVITDKWQKARDACSADSQRRRLEGRPFDYTDTGGVNLTYALEMLDDPAHWDGSLALGRGGPGWSAVECVPCRSRWCGRHARVAEIWPSLSGVPTAMWPGSTAGADVR
jgi:hypothetical protein